MELNTSQELIDDIRQGKMVILMDDEDRENEGDLVMAAEHIRATDINFMAHHGRGLICLTLTQERCEQLKLPLMVSDNNALYGTNFTLSIEAREGVTTGISAADRAKTVQVAVAKNARDTDIVQPGHIFPIKAKKGGVLTRAGHTEAGCDLARLAGCEPASVIVEILNEDGTMARRPELEKYAKEFDLKIGTIADLIRYRLENERSLVRESCCEVTNEFGQFKLYAFRDKIDNEVHFALVKGSPKADVPTMVRVHMPHYMNDVLGVNRGDTGWPLNGAMARINKEGMGVIVLLSQKDAMEGVVQCINSYHMADIGSEEEKRESKPDLRTYGVGAQILLDLGVKKMRVMSAPKIMHGLSGFGLEVVEYVSQ